MAGGTINATKWLQRQGINKDMLYAAKVVNNNDPRKRDRIQARIEGVFDNILDEDLPWAIAIYSHPDGAYNGTGNAVDRSGMSMIPKVGHKVGIKFPSGDAHRPVWTGYTVDDQTALPEATDKNYPDRAVFKFSNGTYMIIDTRTNEVFLNNAGDVNLTILGDVNEYIVGNQQLTITDSKSDIAGYLLNAPEMVLNRLAQNPAKQMPFKGLLSKGYSGNQHTYIKGDQTTEIKGNRKTIIHGTDYLEVKKDRFEKIVKKTYFLDKRDGVVQGNDSLKVTRSKISTVSGLNRVACARSETNG